MNTILDFLTDLKQHNDRNWFADNKTRYTDAMDEFRMIIDTLIGRVKEFDPSIGELSSKECIFRIYRDARFSNDKTPYKCHLGGYIARDGGRKSPYGGYYLHIEPSASFVSGGIYMPQPEVLKSLRKEIFYNLEAFESIVNAADFRAEFGDIKGDKLKRPPLGYTAETPGVEYLKHKDIYVDRPMSDKEIVSADFMDSVVRSFRLMQPFNAFLNEAVE